MPETEKLPVRYCHGCEQYDNHPRTTVVIDANRPDLDRIYHVDCVPGQHVTSEVADLRALREGGARGDDLRAAVAEYAANLPEAPADTKRKG